MRVYTAFLSKSVWGWLGYPHHKLQNSQAKPFHVHVSYALLGAPLQLKHSMGIGG